MDLPVFVSVFSKFFFILTPFFVIAVFLTITDEENTETKHALAIRVTVGVLLISAILFIFGQEIFKLLGISVDAFRIIICQNNFRHSFSLTWSGKTCDIRRSL